MQITDEFASTLALEDAASRVTKTPMLQMPRMISERSLEDEPNILADVTKERSLAGFNPVIEMITMPKSGFGPRPIGIFSPETRTLYEALGDRLRANLPRASRENGINKHEEFGTATKHTNNNSVLVDFDIAACYEYIDHELLCRELTLQAVTYQSSLALKQLLGETFSRGIGIPQAMETSHLLADAYLNKVERGLVRTGYEVDRFADDFRVIVPDLERAHASIEHAVELARSIGLVLADGKTNIRTPAEILRELSEQEATYEAYREQAQDELRSIELIQVGYEDFVSEEIDADDDDVDFAALSKIVDDWANNLGASSPQWQRVLARLGSRALLRLHNAPDRIKNESLLGIVTQSPLRLYSVVGYLSKREEISENWSAVNALTRISQQSPWSRLWILHLADFLETGGSQDETEVFKWAKTLLTDRHEVVRAEAVWLLSKNKSISSEELGAIYMSASDITRNGISASAARLGGGSPNSALKAIKHDSQLNKISYRWGEFH